MFNLREKSNQFSIDSAFVRIPLLLLTAFFFYLRRYISIYPGTLNVSCAIYICLSEIIIFAFACIRFFFVLYLFLYLIDHFNDSTFAKISRIPVFCNLFKIIFCYYCRQLEKIIACSSFLQQDF